MNGPFNSACLDTMQATGMPFVPYYGHHDPSIQAFYPQHVQSQPRAPEGMKHFIYMHPGVIESYEGLAVCLRTLPDMLHIHGFAIVKTRLLHRASKRRVIGAKDMIHASKFTFKQASVTDGVTFLILRFKRTVPDQRVFPSGPTAYGAGTSEASDGMASSNTCA
jgi:hypothetical protein